MESEQVTPVDSIEDVVRISVKVPDFDRHLKKAEGHIGRNIVEITINMKTIVWKPLMIKKTEYQYFNQRGDISTLKGGPLKLVDKFTYFRGRHQHVISKGMGSYQ